MALKFALLDKFTTWRAFVEPQNYRFFAEFSHDNYRHAVGVIERMCNSEGRQKCGVGSGCFPLRRLVELGQVQPAALLFLYDFQPHFQLFQSPS